MTTVITRLFADEPAARQAVRKLRLEGFPADAVSLVSGADAAAELEAAKADDSAVKAYAPRIANGAAAVVVRATYKPLGAAKIARTVLDGEGPEAVWARGKSARSPCRSGPPMPEAS